MTLLDCQNEKAVKKSLCLQPDHIALERLHILDFKKTLGRLTNGTNNPGQSREQSEQYTLWAIKNETRLFL